MRRNEFDYTDQPVRNLFANPGAENTTSAITVRTNFCTNPGPQAVGGVTQTMRTNYASDPRATTVWGDYSGAGNQTITAVTGITGHPAGFTTANRVSYVAGAANPGVVIFNSLVANTKYTMSAWVYHETVPGNGGQAFAMAGVISQSPTPAIVQGQWQRISWTYTTNASPTYFGFRVASPTGDGSFLITGLLIEKSGYLGDYFDGTGSLRTNLANDPRATTLTGTTGVGWRNTRWFGGNGTTVGTHTNVTGATDGPTPQLTTYIRKKWTGTNLNTSNGDTGFDLANGFHTAANTSIIGAWNVQGGATYSLSGWLRPTSDKANAGFDITWRDSGGFYISRSNFASNTLTANTWTRLSATVTAPSGAVTAGMVLDVDGGSLWQAGETLDGTGLVVERIDNVTPVFYEGTGDYSYSWVGAANASFSIQTAISTPSLSGPNNSIVLRSGIAGNYFARIFFTSDQIMDSGIAFQGAFAGITASKTYTLSCDVWVDRDRSYRFSVQGAGTANTNVYFTQTGGTSVRRSVTFQTNSSATGASNVALYLLRSDTQFGYIDISNILIEEGPQANYFDGSMAAAGDFTYSWSGVANGSTSLQRGIPPLKVGFLNAGVTASTEWSAHGSRSIRVTPNSNSADSFAYITPSINLQTGKTYTILATLRLPAAQTGIIDNRARCIMVFHSNGWSRTASTANVAGIYQHKLTFTVTDGSLYQNIRLYNGAQGGGGDVWWDNVMLVEGTYGGDFVNAVQNPFAKWDGVVNDSTSVGYPLTLTDVADVPILDLSSPGTYTLDDSFGPSEARTFYTVFEELGENFAGVSPIIQYGSVLSDVNPYTYIQLRQDQDSSLPNGMNNVFLRRTGANGVTRPGKIYSRHIAAWGVNSSGILFMSLDNGNIGVDPTAQVMNMGHKTMLISSDQPLNKHVRTIGYRGEHDAATRAAITRYLAAKYSVSVA